MLRSFLYLETSAPQFVQKFFFCQICSTIITLHIFAPLLFLPGGIGHFFSCSLTMSTRISVKSVILWFIITSSASSISRLGWNFFQFFFKVDHAHPPAYLLLSSWIQYHYNTQGTQKNQSNFSGNSGKHFAFSCFSVRNCGHAAIPPGLQECSVA